MIYQSLIIGTIKQHTEVLVLCSEAYSCIWSPLHTPHFTFKNYFKLLVTSLIYRNIASIAMHPVMTLKQVCRVT